MQIGSILFTSLILTLLMSSLLSHLAHPRLIDFPNDRSAHDHPKPRIGGLAIFIGFAVASCLLNFFPLFLTLGVLCFFVIGLLDDFLHLRPLTKLAAQIAAAIVLTYGDTPLLILLTPFLGTYPTQLALIFIVLTFVNFYNFMDGIDGILALGSLLQFSLFVLISKNIGPLIIIPSLLGFLPYNWYPSKMFMGDSGSHLIGAFTVSILLMGPSLEITSRCFLLTLPFILDPSITLLIRIIKGKNILMAHREHLYQRLYLKGMKQSQIAILYACCTALLGALLLIA